MDKKEKVIKGLECCLKADVNDCEMDCPYFNDCGGIQSNNTALMTDALTLLKAQEPKWTPITFRALTEEEKEEHPDWCYIFDGPTPDDGEEILVSDGRYVWADAWNNNGVECYLESDHELEGVAWMKMPTPWRKEANT